MSDSKINLPKTSFSMRANLPSKEPQILDYWDKIDLYPQLRNQSKNKEKFILHDGPPYANGNIHMGTALNKILKDIVVKFHQMSDKNSVYVPGWDCHGLPIEWKIEEEYKKNKKNKNDVPIIKFRGECREFAKKWIDIHISQFKRLGVIGDWKNYYTTMSNTAEAQIVRELAKFLKNGSLYKGFKPVLWSTVEKTALADAEVEYLDHVSDTIYVSFPVKKTKNKFLENSEILIWTTTPWTIPANKALAYNKDLIYLIIKTDNKKFVVAKELFESFKNECSIKEFSIIEEFSGSKLEGTICSHPLLNFGYDYDVPLLEAKFVTTEQGTGIVHCAPSHGPDDFNLCLKAGIKAVDTIDDNGQYTNNIIKYKGLHIFKANTVLIEDLKKQKKLIYNGKLNHSYPHSWRSKAPLVHRATPQWFISMEKNKLRDKALSAIETTDFFPPKGKERIKSMIETRPDWCISRQRVWGVPLPIFISKKDKEVLVDDDVFENIAKIFEKEGSDTWFRDDYQKFLGSKYKASDYEKLNDIVEVWFDSGSTHSFVLEKRNDLKWPASMYLEGSDQHRGWFHSSLLQSCGTRGKAPFESILSHGFVVDGKGYKMSKSLGNVISPNDILKKYGADILRLWVASSDYSEDLKIDEKILDQNAEAYRKIRNTFRYILGNINDNYEDLDLTKIKLNEFEELEQYLFHRVYMLQDSLSKNFKNYNFHLFFKDLHNFCTLDLSSFYFDIRKDCLYCDTVKSKKRIQCIKFLNILLKILLSYFAPILSFTTEEIYQILNKDKKQSIHLKSFPSIPSNWKNDVLNEKWSNLRKIKDIANISIEEKRNKKEIGSSLEASIDIKIGENFSKLIKNLDLPEFFITSKVNLEIDKKLKDEVIVNTKKAKGVKCKVCWKINEIKCSRHG